METTESVHPVRLQRRRARGFQLPPNTVCVDRTSRWGNPFRFNSPRDGLARVPAIDGSPWEYESRISSPGTDHAFHHPDGRVTRHKVRLLTRSECVELYRSALLTGEPLRLWFDSRCTIRITPEVVRAELAGKNLACFCALNQLCHADVLLAVANLPEGEPECPDMT